MMRNRWGGRNVIVDGFGYRSLYEDAFDGTARTALAGRLASTNARYLWICIGTNDYAADQDWNAADFGAAYADLLDKIHAAAPSMKIFCQSMIQREAPAAETANSFGNTLGDYRTQISTAVSTRTSFCTYVEGAAGAIVPLGNSSDGIHPNSDGHRYYAEFVHQYLYGLKVGATGTTTVGTTGTTTVK
jgi:lysophospholipase L1-like esterase